MEAAALFERIGIVSRRSADRKVGHRSFSQFGSFVDTIQTLVGYWSIAEILIH